MPLEGLISSPVYGLICTRVFGGGMIPSLGEISLPKGNAIDHKLSFLIRAYTIGTYDDFSLV